MTHIQPLDSQERALLARLRRTQPARNARLAPLRTLGERISDWIAQEVGSWRFVLLQTIFFGAWIALNVGGWMARWDPYPFILLNLILSFEAAYTAPFIMMSQNRQAAIDRHQAAVEYEINVQAALEIKLLHEKLDAMRVELANLRSEIARLQQQPSAPQITQDALGAPGRRR